MPNFDHIPCPALITNRAGLIQAVNQELLALVGGTAPGWLGTSMEGMFPVASRMFLQTHVWPMLSYEGRIREIRLQLCAYGGATVPVFVNGQRMEIDGLECYAWVLFVSVERGRYEQQLLSLKQRAERIAQDLATSERFVRTVTDAVPSMIAYWDTDLQCQFANHAYLQWAGKTLEEMQGLPMAQVLGAAQFAHSSAYLQKALAGAPQEFEHPWPRADGAQDSMLVHFIPDMDARQVVKGVFAVMTNISRLREADAAIRLTASVFEATSEGILVTDAKGTTLSVNPAFTTLTGYTEAALLGSDARRLLAEEHPPAFFAAIGADLRAQRLWRGELWCQRSDGQRYLGRIAISAMCNEQGELLRLVCVCSDITDQWNKEQLVRHMALHDGLTGLPNRTLLQERLGQLIHMAGRERRTIVLMFLDLDGFKQVNDTWGHNIGDQVLKLVASRLQGLVRSSDTVARLGGDEFVVLLDNPEGMHIVEKIGTAMIALLNEPLLCGDVTARVGTSIGIAAYQHQGETAQDMLKRADAAMYLAKANGKNRFVFAS